jgi:hypothetical protein
MHLSIYCEVAMKVWKDVFAWLDINFAFPHDLFSLLNDLMEAGGRKLRKELGLIWNSVIWTLWRNRNTAVFENRRWEVSELVEKVKVLSWKWWLSQSKVPQCLFYEWWAVS